MIILPLLIYVYLPDVWLFHSPMWNHISSERLKDMQEIHLPGNERIQHSNYFYLMVDAFIW
jgi:hypothetical protein